MITARRSSLDILIGIFTDNLTGDVVFSFVLDFVLSMDFLVVLLDGLAG